MGCPRRKNPPRRRRPSTNCRSRAEGKAYVQVRWRLKSRLEAFRHETRLRGLGREWRIAPAREGGLLNWPAEGKAYVGYNDLFTGDGRQVDHPDRRAADGVRLPDADRAAGGGFHADAPGAEPRRAIWTPPATGRRAQDGLQRADHPHQGARAGLFDRPLDLHYCGACGLCRRATWRALARWE